MPRFTPPICKGVKTDSLFTTIFTTFGAFCLSGAFAFTHNRRATPQNAKTAASAVLPWQITNYFYLWPALSIGFRQNSRTLFTHDENSRILSLLYSHLLPLPNLNSPCFNLSSLYVNALCLPLSFAKHNRLGAGPHLRDHHINAVPPCLSPLSLCPLPPCTHLAFTKPFVTTVQFVVTITLCRHQRFALCQSPRFLESYNVPWRATTRPFIAYHAWSVVSHHACSFGGLLHFPWWRLHVFVNIYAPFFVNHDASPFVNNHASPLVSDNTNCCP